MNATPVGAGSTSVGTKIGAGLGLEEDGGGAQLFLASSLPGSLLPESGNLPRKHRDGLNIVKI